MTNKVFTEIGYGNDTFINTEIEYSDGSEVRTPGFKKMKIKGVYLRLWLGSYKVYVLSSVNGYNTQIKKRKDFKILLGIEGLLS